MKATAWYLCLIVAVGLVSLTTALSNVAAESVQRTMRGTVTATNLTVDPQTIVIKVLLPNRKELTVGARVPTETRIMRGKKAVRLADLKVGETAEITYLKSPNGLIARSIHVR
jgi:hypothetical protein